MRQLQAIVLMIYISSYQYAECQTSIRSDINGEAPIRPIDENGINLSNGMLIIPISIIQFGRQVRPISLTYTVGTNIQYKFNITTLDDTGWLSPTYGSIQNIHLLGKSAYIVNHKSAKIVNSDGSWTFPSFGQDWMEYRIAPNSPQKSNNYFSPCYGDRLYLSDGTSAEADCSYSGLKNVRYPDGEEWTYHYQNSNNTNSRLKFITSSSGYALQFRYVSDVTSSPDYRKIFAVDGYNKAYTYCNESAAMTCSNVISAALTGTFNINFANKTYDIGNSSGEISRIYYNVIQPTFGDITALEHINSGTSPSYYEYTGVEPSRYVSKYTINEKSWNYFYQDDADNEGIQDSTATSFLRKTDPDGKKIETFSNIMFGGIYLYQDFSKNPNDPARISEMEFYNGAYRSYTSPEMIYSGNRTTILDRDQRANVKTRTMQSKIQGSLPDLVTSAAYVGECLDLLTCNKPNSITDERGHTIQYQYDSGHGGITRETQPAVNGISPVRRFYYAQRYAWVKDAGSGYVHAGAPIWVITQEKICRTTETLSNDTCLGGASDEFVTSYGYGPDSGPNNLQVREMVAQSGDGALLTRTCYGYDTFGRKISETSPRANLLSCP